ncbi:MAG TPA: hypothetical protein VFQ89_02095, partial [Candidatus Binatia bacterium]|nr:hypothetical protein [Candidatus Binatia bacterium]
GADRKAQTVAQSLTRRLTRFQVSGIALNKASPFPLSTFFKRAVTFLQQLDPADLKLLSVADLLSFVSRSDAGHLFRSVHPWLYLPHKDFVLLLSRRRGRLTRSPGDL